MLTVLSTGEVGPQILAECRENRRTSFPEGLPTGKAVITGGGSLKARYVIHTVGPIFSSNNGRDSELLADAYRNSLELAAAKQLSTVAFPSISTGAYSYAKSEAAKVVSGVLVNFFSEPSTIREVRLVFFHDSDLSTFINNCSL